eukprot:352749-Chlamydomonas_euryale.AAC.2
MHTPCRKRNCEAYDCDDYARCKTAMHAEQASTRLRPNADFVLILLVILEERARPACYLAAS